MLGWGTGAVAIGEYYNMTRPFYACQVHVQALKEFPTSQGHTEVHRQGAKIERLTLQQPQKFNLPTRLRKKKKKTKKKKNKKKTSTFTNPPIFRKRSGKTLRPCLCMIGTETTPMGSTCPSSRAPEAPASPCSLAFHLLKSLGKRFNISSSDRFPLQPTRRQNIHWIFPFT